MDESTDEPETLRKISRRLLQEEDSVFGSLQPLKTEGITQLPTYREVGRAIAYLKGRENLIRQRQIVKI